MTIYPLTLDGGCLNNPETNHAVAYCSVSLAESGKDTCLPKTVNSEVTMGMKSVQLAVLSRPPYQVTEAHTYCKR
jgi:hypothetical protein